MHLIQEEKDTEFGPIGGAVDADGAELTNWKVVSAHSEMRKWRTLNLDLKSA